MSSRSGKKRRGAARVTDGPGTSTSSIEPDPTAHARSHRASRLRAAIVTGGAAKGLAVAVQLVSIGIAARSLGPEAFGSYLVLASLVAWLGLAAVGVGPGLTQRIALATAKGDSAGQAMAFSSAVTLTGLFVVVVAAVVLFVAWLATSGEASQSAIGSDVRMAAMLLVLATAAQVWLSIVEAAQLGHQEQHLTNVAYAIGLAAVLLVLIATGTVLTTVTAFVAATALPPLVAKAANATWYVARRPYLLTRRISMREAIGVVSTSAAFATVSLGSLASQQFGFLWLAFVAGPAAAVPLGVMLRLNLAAHGLVAVVTQPLWPALADAVARRDSAWARHAYVRSSWLTGTYAAAYALGLVIMGSVLVQVWTGTTVQVPPLMMFLFGLYFVVGVWAHVNAITLVGLGKVWVAAGVLCVEAAVSSVGAVVLTAQFGATGVIVSLLIATALVSATLLPLVVRRSWPVATAFVEPRPGEVR